MFMFVCLFVRLCLCYLSVCLCVTLISRYEMRRSCIVSAQNSSSGCSLIIRSNLFSSCITQNCVKHSPHTHLPSNTPQTHLGLPSPPKLLTAPNTHTTRHTLSSPTHTSVFSRINVLHGSSSAQIFVEEESHVFPLRRLDVLQRLLHLYWTQHDKATCVSEYWGRWVILCRASRWVWVSQLTRVTIFLKWIGRIVCG